MISLASSAPWSLNHSCKSATCGREDSLKTTVLPVVLAAICILLLYLVYHKRHKQKHTILASDITTTLPLSPSSTASTPAFQRVKSHGLPLLSISVTVRFLYFEVEARMTEYMCYTYVNSWRTRLHIPLMYSQQRQPRWTWCLVLDCPGMSA